MTSAEILAIITAVGVLSGTLGTIIINIITATKKKIDMTEREIKEQTKQLNKIEILVDGRYSDVLQELANVRRILAASSGLELHLREANDAQKDADEQEKQVEKAELGTEIV